MTVDISSLLLTPANNAPLQVDKSSLLVFLKEPLKKLVDWAPKLICSRFAQYSTACMRSAASPFLHIPQPVADQLEISYRPVSRLRSQFLIEKYVNDEQLQRSLLAALKTLPDHHFPARSKQYLPINVPRKSQHNLAMILPGGAGFMPGNFFASIAADFALQHQQATRLAKLPLADGTYTADHLGGLFVEQVMHALILYLDMLDDNGIHSNSDRPISLSLHGASLGGTVLLALLQIISKGNMVAPHQVHITSPMPPTQIDQTDIDDTKDALLPSNAIFLLLDTVVAPGYQQVLELLGTSSSGLPGTQAQIAYVKDEALSSPSAVKSFEEKLLNIMTSRDISHTTTDEAYHCQKAYNRLFQLMMTAQILAVPLAFIAWRLLSAINEYRFTQNRGCPE